MNISPLAGKPGPASLLVNVPTLATTSDAEQPDPATRFRDRAHLARIQDEAQALVARLFARGADLPDTPHAQTEAP